MSYSIYSACIYLVFSVSSHNYILTNTAVLTCSHAPPTAGDSLMRHIVLSFYILLRDDYEMGLPQPADWLGHNGSSVNKAGKRYSEKHCTCDGQFSGTQICKLPIQTEFDNDHQRKFSQYCPAMVNLSAAEGGGTGGIPGLLQTHFRVSHVNPQHERWKGHNAYNHCECMCV